MVASISANVLFEFGTRQQLNLLELFPKFTPFEVALLVLSVGVSQLE